MLAAPVLALLLAAGAPPAAAQAGPPAALKPAQVVGPGVYVRDLEAQKAWYMSKLGMHVVQAVPQYGEYVMGYGSKPTDPVLILQTSDKRPPGANAFTRVILGVPDAKALAAWLKTQGVESREAVPGVAYFITDPEQNQVELYTPPKP